MKKAIVACLLAVMMVGFSASAFAYASSATYSNQWDGKHTRNWVAKYHDGDGCIVLGSNPSGEEDNVHANRHNRGNNPHKLLAYWLLWYHGECGSDHEPEDDE